MLMPADVPAGLKTGAIKIILIDNHPLLREGLALILGNQPDMLVIAQGNDGKEAVDLYRRCKPDVAIIDLRMPHMNGAEATLQIVQQHPDARVLILTTFDGNDDIQNAMRAGAKGYVLKDSPREDVLHAIRCVYRGQRYLTPSVGGKLAGALGAQPLTDRERGVLTYLAQGKANKAIAFELGIAEGTVKTHVHTLRQKLGVASRTEAALAAIRSGLISADDMPA